MPDDYTTDVAIENARLEQLAQQRERLPWLGDPTAPRQAKIPVADPVSVLGVTDPASLLDMVDDPKFWHASATQHVPTAARLRWHLAMMKFYHRIHERARREFAAVVLTAPTNVDAMRHWADVRERARGLYAKHEADAIGWASHGEAPERP